MAGEMETTASELGIRSAGVATSLTIGKFASIAISTAMFIILAVLLKPAGYGEYTLMLSISGFIGAFGSISIDSYIYTRIPRLVASGKKEMVGVVIGDSVALISCIYAALMAVSIVISYLYFAARFNVSILGLFLAFYGISISSISNIFYFSLIALNKRKGVMASLVSNAAFQAAVSVILVALGFGAVGALTGFAAGATAGFAVNSAYLLSSEKVILRIKGFAGRLRGILRFSLPLTGSTILGTAMSYLSTVVLGVVLPVSVYAGVVGQYGVSLNVGRLIDVVTGSISIVLVPMFSAAYGNKRISKNIGKLFDSSVYFSMLLTIPVIVYISGMSRSIVLSIFGSEYTSVATYMPLLSIGMLLGIFVSYASALLISSGEVKRVFKYTIAIVLAELASLVSVPVFGLLGYYYVPFGVILSLFYIGNIAGLSLYFGYLRKKGIRISGGRILRLLCAGIASAAVLLPLTLLGSYTASRAGSFMLMLAGLALILITYPPFISFSRAVSNEEMSLLRRVSSGIPLLGSMLRTLISYSERFYRE